MLIPIFLISISMVLAADQIDMSLYKCMDKIYCNNGDKKSQFLEVVQKSRIYTDSKKFVDMIQINSPTLTLERFDNLMSATNKNPTEFDVIKFIERNFIMEPEMDQWTPPDFKESPAFLERISDRSIKIFAKRLVNYWPVLGRIPREHVKLYPRQHSLTWVPHGFIIPGGKFNEQTYWDSYWIVKGLLICEMTETVKGMLDNFIFLINSERFKTIPKGARVYYEYRSHPPVFAQMIRLYIEKTNDIKWLENNIDDIESNYDKFWSKQRNGKIRAKGREYNIMRYGSQSDFPRPEKWMEDTTACNTEQDKKNCYNTYKASTESGWDFSTRWMYDDSNSNNGTLKMGDYKRTIPVDLNALLCEAAGLLSDFYDKLGNIEKKEKYAQIYEDKLRLIEDVFYNETDGIWYDFDASKNLHKRSFFPSNFVPLWTECIDPNKKSYYGQKAAEYLYSQGIDTYYGGIPTSLNQKTENNWDFPNAWPPLQEIVATGLRKTGNLDAKKLAKKIGTRFIVASIKGWVSTEGGLYDKYSAIDPGMPGPAGDPVQIGYGWSIGVALSFISQYACSARTLKAILTPLFYTIAFSSFIVLKKVLLCC